CFVKMVKEAERDQRGKTPFSFRDADFLSPFLRQENLASGENPLGQNTLYSAYFEKMADGLFVDLQGKYGANPDKKIAYGMDLYISSRPEDFKKFIGGILKREKANNPTERPQKIFLPLSVEVGENAHSLLLVVEPSLDEKKTRATMINSHGDALTLYR